MKQLLRRCFAPLVWAAAIGGQPLLEAATIQVTANIAANTTWTSVNEYVLNGQIYVLNGATLTIEAGTVVRGKPGDTNSYAALFVTRGGKIYANGTRTKPIIFTAEADDLNDPADLTIADTALWGGIVMLGNAVLNTAVDVVGNVASPKYDLYEGLTDLEINGQPVHRYGGNDDADNSGVLRYVSIRHGGTSIKQDKEINGLSLCAVGNGTVIEHVEVFANADDGFEWFGGTVNSKWLVSAFCEDEEFDTDQGYRGKGQFWFGIHKPSTAQYGMELNGEPNGNAVGNTPTANFEVYNLTLIGDGNLDRAVRIRDYAAPDLFNAVFVDFPVQGIRVDAPGTEYITNGAVNFRETLWHNVGASSAIAQYFFTNAAFNNLVANPMLAGISRTENNGLDPRPTAGSPALSSTIAPPVDGFYSPATFKGAFDADDLWLTRWTALDNYGFLPARTNQVQVTANIAANTTWTSDNEYILNGQIYVLNGAALTIQAGTVVRGKPGDTNSYAALFVTRGGKLYANGTADNPIIFTAEADDLNDPTDLTIADTALWGGIVLLGDAVLNTAVDVVGNVASPKYDLYEGLTDLDINGQPVHRYGGNNDADNSGVLRYVSIRHGGTSIKQDKEINGLSLCAVGNGTVIEHVEVFANADDGFEWFGGTVNSKWLISAFCEDEEFDTDQGYRGKGQFWFGIHKPSTAQYGMELNGEPNGNAVGNTPTGNFEVYNMTLIGDGNLDRAVRIRDYAAPDLFNAIFVDFPVQGIRVDAPGTEYITNGAVNFRETLWHNVGASSAIAQYFFTNAVFNNLVANPMLTGISRSETPAFGLDPRPMPGSPASSSTLQAPNDGFYTPVSFKGSFDGEFNWAVQWTALGEYCIISPVAGAEKLYAETAVPCQPVTLAIVNVGGQVSITIAAEVGVSYELRSTTSLNPIAWNTEDTQTAVASTLTFAPIPAAGNAKFFRVVCQ